MSVTGMHGELAGFGAVDMDKMRGSIDLIYNNISDSKRLQSITNVCRRVCLGRMVFLCGWKNST